MAAPAAALHLLTPGSPAYALAKVSAIGGLIALRLVASRRQSRKEGAEPAEPATAPAEPARKPHPVSSRKRKRRRR